jgi:hypothetical protein
MACPQRGRKRESSGWSGQKLGNGLSGTGALRISDVENLFGIKAADVSDGDRCYEPAAADFVVAIPARGAMI